MISDFKQKEFSHQISEPERLAWMRLSCSKNVGTKTMMDFLHCYGSISKAIDEVAEFSKHLRKKITLAPTKEIMHEIEQTHKFGAQIILPHDDLYPKMLLQIDDFPTILTVKGNTQLLKKRSVAIVGSRNCSLNGRKYSEMLASKLAEQNFCIASGMAAGIDTAAHKGALSVSGDTIAVIAGGIDHIYPKENSKLYEQIAHLGLIISENRFGSKPLATHFPKRNRIVSGISKGVIVVEATKKSGSLITANLALEQNREVFAVPGHPLDFRSQGTNMLIKQGAKLIESADDVTQELEFLRQAPLEMNDNSQDYAKAPFSKFEIEELRELILGLLTHSPIDIDELYLETKVSPQHFQLAIVELELAGAVIKIANTNQITLA